MLGYEIRSGFGAKADFEVGFLGKSGVAIDPKQTMRCLTVSRHGSSLAACRPDPRASES
jgi:hypothetical protein